jgi:hypothetical protein
VSRAESPSPRFVLGALGALSAALLAVRLYASAHVGFGDSEALYAAYALHPQPAYVDHPGLIGVLARLIGEGGAPSPGAAHRVTALASTLLPWVLVGAARAAGATWRTSALAGMALAAAPEIGVGLFAMTPDLPLAFAWTGALGLAAAGLRAEARSARAAATLLFAGVLAGVACAAKVSGALLAVGLVAAYASPPARAHARTPWPWVGLAFGAIVTLPIVGYEARLGFPMLRHRLVDTQAQAGFSPRNVAAVLLGQLAYVSPVLLTAAALAARDLVKARRTNDPVTRLLFATFAIPLVALVTLSAWSRVAEPHWLAPAFLALPIHAARGSRSVTLRLVRASVITGFALVAGVYAWVLVPSSTQLLPASADPRLDLANELVGWPQATDVLRDVLVDVRASDPIDTPIVVGPYWTICAQLSAALGHEAQVGCDSNIPDDFDSWLPRHEWRRAGEVVFVTDSRYPVDLSARFPDRFAVQAWEVPVVRGGRLARTFTITRLVPRAMGAFELPAGTRPKAPEPSREALRPG